MKSYGQITLVKSGLHCSIQDMGRPGLQHLGISPSGAADEHALRWANALLNNNNSAPALQCCMANVELHFTAATYIAICGADCDITVNNRARPNWSAIRIAAGDTLKLSQARSGLYSYIAISGGLQVVKQLGSAAVNEREGLGANSGKALSNGICLSYKAPQTLQLMRTVHWSYLQKYSSINLNSNTTAKKDQEIRFIPAQQWWKLPPSQQQLFLGSTWHIGSNSNQMGLRLQGPCIKTKSEARLSSPLAAGAIQLPADGQPIAMMKQHQSIGGYPLLGSVYKSDLCRLAQLAPGQSFSFELGSIEQAQKAYALWLAQWDLETSE
ncbi:biotin-dependent carboxyltransferase family protein [Agaribacterium sp. ZY112]|uniref:5-oxoprolinase subunit C family protein n=1 Tax=Agaribacterium sp. ZY112 TaxID=3233574 RepID=UPI0035235F19